MSYTKEIIQHNLSTNPKWIERGLIVLYNRQTSDEQNSGQTRIDNGMGFNGSDSRYLTYCSKWILRGNHLSGHHIQKCGSKLKKYWRQIIEEIELKNKK
jgi:hypothetical protein